MLDPQTLKWVNELIVDRIKRLGGEIHRRDGESFESFSERCDAAVHTSRALADLAQELFAAGQQARAQVTPEPTPITQRSNTTDEKPEAL